MIRQPEEMTFTDKKFSMIIYGSPGLGKTTLALSAPAPVIIDFDRGISRVKAYHRKTTIECQTYEEVLDDLQSPIVKDCQTLIIDTGGSFISFLQDWAMRSDPASNQKKKGGISQSGYGAVKVEFARFTSLIRDIMNKNLIYVFHSDEQKDKDGIPQQRLICEGSSRNTVWTPCDFGGYMQMLGNKRYISFTPEQEFFAKGCHGIEGRYEVPSLGPADKNDFLTKLFAQARANIAADNEAFAPVREQYNTVMKQVLEIIKGISTVDDATKAAHHLPTLNHAMTSKTEASNLLKVKAKELNLLWDKEAQEYRMKEAE